MSSEFKYIPYSSNDEELRGLVKNGNVMNLRQSMSGILLPDDSDTDIVETERDLQYLKEMYPGQVRTISAMVEEECDKLEYAGSPMLVEYPDREYIRKIAREIYDRLDVSEDMELPQYTQSMQVLQDFQNIQTDSITDAEADVAASYIPDYPSRQRNGRPMPVPPPYVPNNRGCVNCVLRNLIETMICNEFYCRRDRYRRRRRRFY